MEQHILQLTTGQQCWAQGIANFHHEQTIRKMQQILHLRLKDLLLHVCYHACTYLHPFWLMSHPADALSVSSAQLSAGASQAKTQIGHSPLPTLLISPSQASVLHNAASAVLECTVDPLQHVWDDQAVEVLSEGDRSRVNSCTLQQHCPGHLVDSIIYIIHNRVFLTVQAFNSQIKACTVKKTS